MKATKTILNVLGIILASILSIILIALLIAAPFVSAASSFVKPNTIKSVITNIFNEQVFPEDDLDIEQGMEDFGVPKEIFGEIMDSKAVDDFLKIYTEDLSLALNGKATEKSLTPEALITIANENIDELADIFIKIVPEEEFEDKSEEQIKQKVKTELLSEVEQNAENIIDALPDMSEVVTEVADEQTLKVIKNVQNGTYTLIVWLVILGIALIIYGCRFVKQEGFIWLGVNFSLSFIITLGMGIMLSGKMVDTLKEIMDIDTIFVTPIISAVSKHIILISIIFLVLALLSIGAFILFYRKRKEKAATCENDVL